MGRMTYLWTAEDWRQSFQERIANLTLLNIINVLAVVGTFLLPAQIQDGADARFFLPAFMLAVDFAVCYAFLDDIHNGHFAGITCGASFGVAMVALLPCADAHVSAIVPPLLGVAVAFLCFLYAIAYYCEQLSLLQAGRLVTGRKRRRRAC